MAKRNVLLMIPFRAENLYRAWMKDAEPIAHRRIDSAVGIHYFTEKVFVKCRLNYYSVRALISPATAATCHRQGKESLKSIF